MNGELYQVDVSVQVHLLLRTLVRNEIENPVGKVNMLMRQLLPVRNGSLTKAINWLDEGTLPDKVCWKLTVILTDIWQLIKVPHLNSDRLEYHYIESKGIVTINITPTEQIESPTQWLVKLKESGYDVPTNTERLFKQYQDDSYLGRIRSDDW